MPSVKFNSLLANLVVFHTAVDMMSVIRELITEGWQVSVEDLAQLSPYLVGHVRRPTVRASPARAGCSSGSEMMRA